nr:hypothetical protein GCM10020063_008030 [Dactylosporangium thailandense]
MSRPQLGARFTAPRGVPEGPGWHHATVLTGPMLHELVADHARARDTGHLVAAASLLFCQYVNQVTGPVLARCFLEDRIVDAAAAGTWIHIAGGRLDNAAFAGDAAGDRPRDDTTTGWLVERMLDENFAPAIDAWHRVTRVGRRTLWGNVASGIATAMRSISWTQDDPARFVTDTVALLDRHPRTRDLCVVADLAAGDSRWQVHHRRTCCLMYKTGDGSFCATCSVLPAPERAARARRMVDTPTT